IEDERILLGSHQSNTLAFSEKLIAEFDKVWKSPEDAQSYRFHC
ncbi:12041_t:CDS:1, partial [Funneliformis geosporum]